MSVCVSGEESVYSDDDDREWNLQKKLLQGIPLSSACSDENCSEDEDDESAMKCCSWISQCKRNWTSVVAIIFLWTAYTLNFAAYSTITAFFPQVVSILLSM